MLLPNSVGVAHVPIMWRTKNMGKPTHRHHHQSWKLLIITCYHPRCYLDKHHGMYIYIYNTYCRRHTAVDNRICCMCYQCNCRKYQLCHVRSSNILFAINIVNLQYTQSFRWQGWWHDDDDDFVIPARQTCLPHACKCMPSIIRCMPSLIMYMPSRIVCR